MSQAKADVIADLLVSEGITSYLELEGSELFYCPSHILGVTATKLETFGLSREASEFLHVQCNQKLKEQGTCVFTHALNLGVLQLPRIDNVVSTDVLAMGAFGTVYKVEFSAQGV